MVHKKRKLRSKRLFASLGLFFGFVALMIVIVFGLTQLLENNIQPVILTDQVCINDDCFLVELAITDEEKEVGLMFRGYLEPDTGMLFIFDEPDYYSFWMKNTLIHLDIIWINQNKEIVHIEERAEPCRESCRVLTPYEEAVYVLEIAGGLVEKLGIEKGMNVDIFIS